MPRKPQPWFRFYVEAFSDRKILRLPASRRWLWVAILGAARESPEPGRLLIAEGESMTVKELARYADVSMRDTTEGLAQMRNLGMIRGDDPIEVINWEQRQFESDNVTVRTTAYRERSKERSNAVPENVHGNVPRAHMTETETETDNPSLRSGEARAEARRTRTTRGTRLPPDFQPTPEATTQMHNECPGVDLQSETRKFIDYWTAESGQRATKVNWQSAWKNWIRGTHEKAPNHANSQLKSKRQQERDAMFDRQLARAKERDAANEPRTNSETSTPNRSMLPSTEPR